MFRNPAPDDICALLAAVRTIAVVGLSPRPMRPSHRVARAMQQWGYRIVPVRPAVTEVLGERAYPSLQEVPGDIDLVNVFLAPERVGPVVEACIARGVRRLWLQDGVVNEAAAERAQAAGITVVMDRCIWRDRGGCGQRAA